jgi:iron complex transport system substrate-binding protein
VVVLERGHKLIPGPRQIEAVAEYARALHPERFS